VSIKAAKKKKKVNKQIWFEVYPEECQEMLHWVFPGKYLPKCTAYTSFFMPNHKKRIEKKTRFCHYNARASSYV